MTVVPVNDCVRARVRVPVDIARLRTVGERLACAPDVYETLTGVEHPLVTAEPGAAMVACAVTAETVTATMAVAPVEVPKTKLDPPPRNGRMVRPEEELPSKVH